MIRVKICGLREVSHALAAVEADADFIGLVFAPSARRVGLPRAQEIARAVRKRSPSTRIVGVFANAPLAEVHGVATACSLDRVQLSGDESPAYALQLGRPVVKAFHTRDVGALRRDLEVWTATLGEKFIPLLDSRAQDSYGGTGIVFDWELARAVAKGFPVILAGGLTPDNVGNAVAFVSPWGVDVSSGVERGGVKSPARIRAFIAATRRAEMPAAGTWPGSIAGQSVHGSPDPS
ncbi:MAG: phosphoribosylanthranilate isomerase [Chloroflexota bacterium]